MSVAASDSTLCVCVRRVWLASLLLCGFWFLSFPIISLPTAGESHYHQVFRFLLADCEITQSDRCRRKKNTETNLIGGPGGVSGSRTLLMWSVRENLSEDHNAADSSRKGIGRDPQTGLVPVGEDGTVIHGLDHKQDDPVGTGGYLTPVPIHAAGV